MRKIRFLRVREADIVIYDAEASWILQHSIPKNASVLELETRRVLNVIWSFRFAFTFARHLLRERNISTALLFSVFDSLRCRVIVTKSALQPYLGRYATLRPNCLVIAVQTAIHSAVTTKLKIGTSPIYYCFGQAQKDQFSMLEIPAKELVCVGSYDMGVFLRSKAPLLHQVSRTYDICFVSGYRPQIESATETDPFYKILRDAHDRLLAHTVRLCHENDLSLLIVGRQRHPVKDEVFPEEEDYFNKRCTSCDFDILCSSKPSLSSYAGVLSAEAVVHLYSTLGWEALGVKKKVLFGGGINSEMLEPMDILYWVKFLPECLLLDSASFSEFSTKVLRLLAMDKQQYVEIAGRAGKYYMDQNQDHPPHEVIRDRIKLALS